MVKKRTKATKPAVERRPTVQGELTLPPLLDITTRDAEGRTPLHQAAFLGHSITVHRMLEQQADTNARDAGERTPGHWSAFKGHLDIIRMLMESGTDANARDAGGRTLLRMAIIGRQTAMETLLRLHGAVL